MIEFLSAGSQDFPVPCFGAGTGDWKVARTRRLDSLRYGRNVIRLRFSGLMGCQIVNRKS